MRAKMSFASRFVFVEMNWKRSVIEKTRIPVNSYLPLNKPTQIQTEAFFKLLLYLLRLASMVWYKMSADTREEIERGSKTLLRQFSKNRMLTVKIKIQNTVLLRFCFLPLLKRSSLF